MRTSRRDGWLDRTEAASRPCTRPGRPDPGRGIVGRGEPSAQPGEPAPVGSPLAKGGRSPRVAVVRPWLPARRRWGARCGPARYDVTAKRDFKRLVRSRMRTTGEPYTAALLDPCNNLLRFGQRLSPRTSANFSLAAGANSQGSGGGSRIGSRRRQGRPYTPPGSRCRRM